MHPYSIINDLKQNKRRFFSVSIAIFLGVFLIHSLNMVISGMEEAYARSTLDPKRSMSAISARGSTMGAGKKAELEKQESIAFAMPVVTYNIPVAMSLGGVNNTPLYILSGYDIGKVMEALGMKLVEGRLPRPGRLETVLHADVAKVLGLKTGDRIGSGLNNAVWLSEEYDIVGIIEGKPMVSFARLIIDDAYKYGFLLLPKKGRLEEMNRYVESLATRTVSVSTYNTEKAALDGTLNNIRFLVIVMSITVLIIVSVCTGFLCFIYYSQRKNEYGLVWALGYTRQAIVNRSLIEIGLMNAVGFLSGLLASLLTGLILNVLVYKPAGQPLILMDGDLLAKSLCVPLFSGFFSVLPVWRFLKALEPIQTIEGVD